MPLWEIVTQSFQIPISLNYTGGNGIKLEEVSSWVGLGWGLVADFNVSRVVNGFQDDKYKGFLDMTEIPVKNQANAGLYQEFAKGERDSEPDFFSYSLPDGEQGSFVFDLADSVKLKEKKNIKISYSRDNNNLINAFTIIGANGNIYYFTSAEKTFSWLTDAPPLSDPNYYATSWYLTKMVNHNRTDSIVYEYSQDTYSITNEIPVSEYVSSGGELSRYSDTRYQASRLSKIRFSKGAVEFIPSTISRKDVGCCTPFLDKILVKNNQGTLLRSIQFNYAYFTVNGNYAVTDNINSTGIRLKLLSVVISPGGTGTGPGLETKFEYFEDYRLPERNSKARDHWGYYNGKSNTTLEQKRTVKIKTLGGPWEIVELGQADRSPSFEYAKSYLLKKITYPTGGTADFTFEANTVKSNKLFKKEAVGASVIQAPGEMIKTITVTSASLQQVKITVRCLIADLDATLPPGQVVYRILFIRQSDNIEVQRLEYYSLTNPASRANRSFYIAPGVYSVQLQVVVNTNDMFASFPYNYENETACNNCEVGGVRLKSIVNFDGIGQSLRKTYNYEDSTGVSSGTLAVIPEYGYYQINDQGVPFGYVSTVTSSYPMTTTQGNTVGYGKVTESADAGYSNGKTEYYFTTFNDFPDNDRGRIYYDCDDWVTYDGVLMHRYPVPTIDSRDFLRGLLKKRIDYLNQGSGVLTKIKETENIYEIAKYNTCQTVHVPDENLMKDYIRQTAAFKGSWGLGYYIRDYELYGGYAKLKETIERTYVGGNEIAVSTKTDYGRNADGYINSFVPSKIETVNSANQTITTLLKYPADFAGTAPYDQMKSRNIVNQLVEQEQLNTTLNKPISKLRMTYGSFLNNTLITLQSVNKSIAGNGLEQQDVIEEYDSFGNICQVKGKDGITTSFLWGYKSNELVAKVVGSGYLNARQYINQAILDNAATTDAQMRTELNKLRENLPGAQVITYTYAQLVGITSETDPNGNTLFYEYDAMGRLSLIRDKDGNIVKKFSYNYWGQVGN
ncbi:RHS repeat domain-containing protein [Pseudoflavitalea sp. G-6-1-2]|uniref:RHS repeat domain-containing protein n=1 Tax=Pseudoflavitalea sp. G-6-1-2 TaxID=2728841 RepID=UPI00197F3B2B